MDLGALIPTFGNLAFTVVAFIVALSIIVAIHEYGHYIVGRWTGIKAETFSIGFGKVLFARTDKHGTQWQIAALPFGGYVKFKGDANAASAPDGEMIHGMSPEELRSTMQGAPLWARAATVFAGPAFNFVLSFLLFTAIVLVRGVASDPITVDEVFPLPPVEAQGLQSGDVLLRIEGQEVPAIEDFGPFGDELEAQPVLEYTVERDGQEQVVTGNWLYPPLALSVAPASAASDGGIEEGDVVLSVDGEDVFDFGELREIVGDSGGNPLALKVWRDGETLDITLQPKRQDLPLPDGGFETRWLIGLSGGLFFEPASRTPGIGEALLYGVDRTGYIIQSSLSGLYHMVVGKISTCNLSGPIKIAETSGHAASAGGFNFIWFIAVLSTAVGLINLFPIPVLDGGHLVFHAYEAVTGRPPSEKALKVLMAGGLSLMLALMVMALGHDIFCP